mgnify:CR=1 FL=1
MEYARIKLESTNTTRVANMSPTAASTGADLNGQAIKRACEQILYVLKTHLAEQLLVDICAVSICHECIYVDDKVTELSWQALISQAYLARCALSAQAHYATPDLSFDSATEKGEPFAYHVYGCAAVEVTLDCLRGCYQVDSVKLVHDVGQSLAPEIDRGQIEGAVVQGLGWMSTEELVYDAEGHLQSDNLATYKIPDIYDAPDIEVHFLQGASNAKAIFNSKAVGEPPFMYGIGAYFALVKAIQAFNPEYKPDFSAPMTAEKVLFALCKKTKCQV